MHVAILGGGISGLTTAYYLNKAGIEFTLIEKGKPGGCIQSDSIDQSIVDFGPNTIRDKDGSILKLIEELGISSQLLTISEDFKTRYIVRDGQLCALKAHPNSLLKSPILPFRDILRILKEPFIKGDYHPNESVQEFFERRIGSEATKYLVDPIFSGIYAGDISAMSAKEIVPTLMEFEKNHGSIFKGIINKRDKEKHSPTILNFKKGIQTLTDALYAKIEKHVIIDEVREIEKSDAGYTITLNEGKTNASHIISTLPAYVLSSLIRDWDPTLSYHLSDIQYPPILSTQLIFNQRDIDFQQKGFGFLVPRVEKIKLLGAIWKTNLFGAHTKEGRLQFNLLAGGAHNTAIHLNDEGHVIDEFKSILQTEAEPIVVKSKLWKHAIPQFHIGYHKIRNQMDAFEQEHPKFYIGGNFRWGVSIPDCVRGGSEIADLFRNMKLPS